MSYVKRLLGDNEGYRVSEQDLAVPNLEMTL